MARHYATRDFFRQMPNPLLARYFHARGVFADLDIAALPEPQPDALWEAWLTLDDTERHAMDAAFRDIAALSGEKGCRAILDDAAWRFATDPAAEPVRTATRACSAERPVRYARRGIHRGAYVSRGREHPGSGRPRARRAVGARHRVGAATGRRRLERRQRGRRGGAGATSAGPPGDAPRSAAGSVPVRSARHPAGAFRPARGDGCRPVASA